MVLTLGSYFPTSPGAWRYPWLFMPVAMPLRTHLGPTPDLSSIVEAIATIAEALAQLAEEEIAHRDIKPYNLYWLDGAAAIGDFGLAKQPDQPELTDGDRAMGLRNFTAP